LKIPVAGQNGTADGSISAGLAGLGALLWTKTVGSNIELDWLKYWTKLAQILNNLVHYFSQSGAIPQPIWFNISINLIQYLSQSYSIFETIWFNISAKSGSIFQRWNGNISLRGFAAIEPDWLKYCTRLAEIMNKFG
jgi:hypothetical protein